MAVTTVIALHKRTGGRQHSTVWYFDALNATTPAEGVVVARDTVLPVLVNFLTNQLTNLTMIESAYVADAYEQPPNPLIPNPSRYTRVTLNTAGDQAPPAGGLADLAPLSICFLWRLEAGLQRPGFKFWKGLLRDTDIKTGGDKGAEMVNPAAIAAFDAALQGDLASTGFGSFLSAGASTVAKLVIPRYTLPEGTNARNLVETRQVTAIHFAGLTGRQTNRVSRTRRRGRNDPNPAPAP